MSHGHHHDHDHDHGHDDVALRVKALEALLVEKGYLATDAVDKLAAAYEHDVGPMNGARVVAKAWSDPAYRARLLEDGTAAIKELGYAGFEGGHVIVCENTDELHNVVVCSLCSCYPWSVLGLPPTWYKDPGYRARVVVEPRTVIAEMGYQVPAAKRIRVWDSSAEVRYMVLPQRPAGTEGMTEDELAGIVTRNSMIGVGQPVAPTGA
jgi:nitrile hydratase